MLYLASYKYFESGAWAAIASTGLLSRGANSCQVQTTICYSPNWSRTDHYLCSVCRCSQVVWTQTSIHVNTYTHLYQHTAAETEGRRRIISKSFHHQLRYHEKQPLVGPPENMREHVVAATHAMRKGDWKKCLNYILSIKVMLKYFKVVLSLLSPVRSNHTYS